MRDPIPGRRLFAALAAVALAYPVVPAFADAAPSTTLSGTVYLPDGSTPATAAVVDLMLADAAGLPVAGSAFARGVTDLAGQFVIDPRERPDLVATARANGGTLPVAVQVADLAPHGSIDPAADESSRAADAALFTGYTVLRLAGDPASASGESFTLPDAGVHVDVSVSDVLGLASPFVGVGADLVLGLAREAWDRAKVAAVFMDPDLVAGNDNPDDPDLVPPLGAIIADTVPIPEAALTTSGSTSSSGVGDIDVSVDPGAVLLPTPEDEENDTPPSCNRDPGTQWVSERQGNNIEGTKTYVYLDTFSCNKDSDQNRDEVVYKWGGYTGSKDKHWTIYRLKYRTEVAKDRDYYMKHPNPVGDVVDGNGGSLTWNVGFDYVATATIGGTYNFKAKKIHGWQGDGTGRLYHVSWINNAREGRYGDGFNNGGGVNLDVPQGSDGRAGVKNEVIIWRCWWPDGYDGSDDDGTGRWRPRCDD